MAKVEGTLSDRVLEETDMLDIPPTIEQVAQLQARLLEAIHGGASQLKTVLPADVLISILKATESALRAEPSLLELSIDNPQAEVFVFGDTHGHFPDVAYMLDQLGYPSPTRIFVFNGDYVDRGSWGVELLGLLCCLKCAAPKSVYLLRGNHESSTCTKYYGYSQEVRAKYEKQSKDVYAASKKLFSVMPLAAVIQGNTIIMHGGLFRRPPEPKRGAKRRKSYHPSRAGGAELVPGSLDDLRRATKGGMDPDGCGASLLATDVLWSDPVAAPGFMENDARGVGLIFGPDVTQAFLTANRLRLIIRSHEGPDARDKRSDLPQVLQGYSIDHDTPAGKLVTVFSAPDYPQFQAVSEDEEGGSQRYDNLAAVAVLSAPDYATPVMRTFAAVKPRPKADAYYDFMAFCDSDTEVPAGSEVSSGGPSGAASEVELDGDEAEGVPVAAPAAVVEASAKGAAVSPAATVGSGPTSRAAEQAKVAAAGEQGAAQAMEVEEQPERDVGSEAPPPAEVTDAGGDSVMASGGQGGGGEAGAGSATDAAPQEDAGPRQSPAQCGGAADTPGAAAGAAGAEAAVDTAEGQGLAGGGACLDGGAMDAEAGRDVT